MNRKNVAFFIIIGILAASAAGLVAARAVMLDTEGYVVYNTEIDPGKITNPGGKNIHIRNAVYETYYNGDKYHKGPNIHTLNANLDENLVGHMWGEFKTHADGAEGGFEGNYSIYNVGMAWAEPPDAEGYWSFDYEGTCIGHGWGEFKGMKCVAILKFDHDRNVEIFRCRTILPHGE